MKDFLFDMIEQAGRISLEYRAKLSSMEVTKKSDKDLVSEGDLAVESYLIDRIKAEYPSHAILGEESGSYGDNAYRWVIDPIDGTTSFVHGQPYYSVSIALEKDGDMILGAVNAPVLKEMFHAEKGQGAFCNGEPIGVSQRGTLIDSVLGTGFACVRSDLEHDNLPYFNKILPKIRGIRRYGSCAVDLSYVACGRLEGFWELNLNLYDMAAGMLILREAGGRVTDFSGDTRDMPGQLVATNGLIHEELLGYLT
ncbi:MAG: inositol monophosphatase [Planctomycetes bacterium]|nr:inositol monophosphatase [Planctomycetota bacterium]